MLRPGFISRYGGAPPAWLPTDLAGLQFWLAPAGLSGVDGDPISTWDDSGALNNDATQATSAKRPVIDTDVSPRAALFDNTDDQLDSPVSAAQKPCTLFAVLKPTNHDDQDGVFAGGDGAFGVDIAPATGILRAIKSGYTVIGSSTNAVPTAGFSYFVVSYDASGNYVIRINGAAEGSGTNDQTFPASTTRIGVGYDGSFYPFNGHIRHAGKYNVVVSGSDLTSLETYLAGQL